MGPVVPVGGPAEDSEVVVLNDAVPGNPDALMGFSRSRSIRLTLTDARRDHPALRRRRPWTRQQAAELGWCRGMNLGMDDLILASEVRQTRRGCAKFNFLLES